MLLILAFLLLVTSTVIAKANGPSEQGFEDRAKRDDQEVLGTGIDGQRYKTACPDYKHYAIIPQYVSNPARQHLYTKG